MRTAFHCFGPGNPLSAPIELLNETAIRGALATSALPALSQLDVHAEIDSTNQFLLDREAPKTGELVVCLAEFQSAGRGRRGRSWQAPSGGGLCMSAGWTFDNAPADLSALTLAAGVVVRRALHDTTKVLAQLKWPNDLIVNGKKLGGILVELRADSVKRCFVVVGIGINVSIDEAELRRLSDWPEGAVDLSTALGARPPSRNLLAARIVEGVLQLFRRYEDRGFTGYHSEYLAADYLRGREVTVDDSGDLIKGRAAGVDDTGLLLVESDGRVQRVIAGEVSVRTAA